MICSAIISSPEANKAATTSETSSCFALPAAMGIANRDEAKGAGRGAATDPG
jgi:hypothetical protein